MIHQEFNKQELLYQDTNRVLYRAIDLSTNKPVILKTFKKDHLSLQDNAILENEFSVCKNISSNGTLTPVKLVRHNTGLLQMWEDFQGISFKDWIRQNPQPKLNSFLRISINIANCLAEIHTHGYSHCNLNSHNILINPTTLELKILNFEQAIPISHYEQETQLTKPFKAVLEYMAPEQTGRINTSVSYQTDFYSLGIILFECLTGRLPFESNSTLDLIYSHIAEIPPSPDTFRKNVPEVLSDIISKCLAKNVDDRYKDTFGLKKDLELSLEKLDKNEKIKDFIVGQYDRKSRFSLSKHLYGREKEIQKLLNIFETKIKTESKLTFVTGESGIGKSKLVGEIYKPVVKKKGYFAQGKFDQYERNVPYFGIIKAMHHLVEQIISEGPQSIENWREKLLASLGYNAGIIVDVIPDLETVLGREIEIPKTDTSDSQLTFHLQFQRFIETFTKNDRPLVLFLDDLQWADSESLSVLEFLLTDKRSKNFLVIGSYRHNEITPSHLLTGFIENISNAGLTPESIQLCNITEIDIQSLICDSITCSKKQSEELSRLTFQKTQGNPFFVHQFLNHIHSNGLINFNYLSGQWEWKINKIEALNVTDNVIELVTKNIKTLLQGTQDILKQAACIGDTFDIETLFYITDSANEDISNELLEAIKSSYLVAKSDQARLLSSIQWKNSQIDWKELNFECRFLHDRVYESVYTLVDKDKKALNHYKIGNFWIQHRPEKSIIDIVRHLNNGLPYSIDLGQNKLAELNTQAGIKAKDNGAYETAHSFFSKGIDYIQNSPWETYYELALRLFSGKAECEYLLGNFDEAETQFKEIINYCKSDIDKARVYNTKLVLHVNQNKHKEAFESGKMALQLLNVSVKLHPNLIKVLIELAKSKLKLPKKFSPNEVEKFPKTINEKIILIIQLLMNLTAPAYYLDKNLFAYVVLRTINLSQDFGNANASAYAYATYGSLLGAVFKDYKLGYKFGLLALELNKKFTDNQLSSKINFIFGALINHWVNPFSSSVEYFEKGFKKGDESGDFVYASYCALYVPMHRFFSGENLIKIHENSAKTSDYLIKTKDNDIYWSHFNLVEVIEILAGKKQSFEETLYIDHINSTKNMVTFIFFHLCKLVVYYFQEKHGEACEEISILKSNLDSFIGLIQSGQFVFFSALVQLKLAHNNNKDQKRYLKAIKSNLKQLEHWNKSSPQNFNSMCHIIKAEIYKLTNKTEKALQHYEKAISEAQKNNQRHIEAISYELAGIYYLSKGMTFIAKNYFQQSRNLYLEWGAIAKAEKLTQDYPNLFVSSFKETNGTNLHETDSESLGKEVDQDSLVEMMQTLSAETDIKQLQKKMLETVIKVAGGQRGVLIFKRDSEFFVEAIFELRSNNKIYKTIKTIPLSEFKRLSKRLINNVIEHKEERILNDAINSQIFGIDAYIQTEKPKSILCIPMIKQNQLEGVIYLENNSMSNAFGEHHIKHLRMLAVQMAITFEVAQVRLKDILAKDVLENRVKEEVSKSEALMEKAQQVSQQAALANLIKDISHELKNPLAIVKNKVERVKKFITQRQDIFGRLTTSFMGKVDINEFKLLCKSDDVVQDILGYLQEQELLTPENELTEKFRPTQLDYLFELPEQFTEIEDAIELYLKELFLKKHNWDLIESMEKQSDRISKITTEMFTYGTAGTGITNSAFLEIMPFIESEFLWQNLVQNGYLNKEGYIQPKFDPTSPNFKLDIDPKFKKYETGIIKIIQNNPASQKAPINLNTILNDVYEHSRGNIAKSFIEYDTDFQTIPDIPGNESIIKRIFVNLLSNSVDALREKDKNQRRLTISTKTVSYLNDNQQKTSGVVVRIQDTGTGISKENLKNIWTPFFTTKSRTGGQNLGLGMGMVLKMVKGYGGKIEVESQKGVGTEFRVYFPVGV